MRTFVYAIFDLKAAAYGVPFFMQNRGIAIRAFGDLVNDSRSSVGKHPSDYVLFELGEFHDGPGEFICHKEPVHLGMASSYVKGPDIWPPAVDPVSVDQTVLVNGKEA